MVSRNFLAASLFACTVLAGSVSHAADGSIAGAITSFGRVLNSVPLPMGGTLGGQSLQSGLNAIPGFAGAQASIPGLAGGVPLFGNITVDAALGVPRGLSPFQQPLPGLDMLP